MKRYRFALESALRARRAQEDVARQRLAEVNHRLSRARALHQAAVEALQAVTLSAASMSAGAPAAAVDRDAFLAARAREVRLAEAIERARRTVTEIEVEAATCYSAWVEAGKQVASLERLDERRRAEWDGEARREEVAAVDDVVVSRWALGPASGRLEDRAV